MTMIVVASTASMPPITCSRLRWRMNASKSAMAARGPTGFGNQDIEPKIGAVLGECQTARSAQVNREGGGALHPIHSEVRRDVLQRNRLDQTSVEGVARAHVGNGDADELVDRQGDATAAENATKAL